MRFTYYFVFQKSLNYRDRHFNKKTSAAIPIPNPMLVKLKARAKESLVLLRFALSRLAMPSLISISICLSTLPLISLTSCFSMSLLSFSAIPLVCSLSSRVIVSLRSCFISFATRSSIPFAIPLITRASILRLTSPVIFSIRSLISALILSIFSCFHVYSTSALTVSISFYSSPLMFISNTFHLPEFNSRFLVVLYMSPRARQLIGQHNYVSI